MKLAPDFDGAVIANRAARRKKRQSDEDGGDGLKLFVTLGVRLILRRF